MDELLQFEDVEPGIQRVTLKVDLLYPEPGEREQFEAKLAQFLVSDHNNKAVFSRERSAVVYLTECIIPDKRDSRLPLLLLFGNPAPISVRSGMFFAQEGNGREHRFWRALSKSGLLSFSHGSDGFSEACPAERNRLKKRALYELSYDSPFRIGLAVHYSMPSVGGSSPWAGVAGLFRLFGKKVMARIAACEKGRVDEIIERFLSPTGAVITFQKDAYLAVKSPSSPEYALAEAGAGRLVAACECNPGVRLFGCPPTRLMHGEKAFSLLRKIGERAAGGEKTHGKRN